MNAKVRKATAITAIVIVALAVVAGIAAGIYFAVKHNRYSGYVYESGTGRPIEGVAVTNGRDVVLTDENGHYRIDGWLKDRFVTVTIPSGYWTDDFYIDAGKAREGYDFYLDKLGVDYTEHSFLQISDTEVNASGVGDWIEDVKDRVESENPAFLIHTGDICYEAGLKSHINGLNSQTVGVPVRYVIGNHDFVDWGGYGEALYESIYGPVNYSLDVGNVHYVVLSLANGDYMARYTKSEVWRWLANDLAAVKDGKKVVIFSHDMCPDENGFTVKYGLNTLDLKQQGLEAWIFGHWHYNYLNVTDSGIFNISTARPDCGGIDSSPAGIRKVTMSGGELVSSEMLYYGFEKQPAPQDAEWSVALSGHGEFAEPVICGDYIYVGTVDDGYPKDCGIYCVDAKSGNIVWEYKTKNSIKNSFYVDGEYVVAQDSEGRVYKLNALSGELIWIKDIDLLAARDTVMGIASDGQRIYCGGGQKIVCLSFDSGEIIWTAENPRGYSAPSRMVTDGRCVYVGSHWDKLIAYDVATGKTIWSNDKDGLRYRTTTPSLQGDVLWVAAESSVFKVDAGSGKSLAIFDVGDYNLDSATAPLIDGNVGYFATADKGVIAVDLTNGTVMWNFATGESLAFTSPYTGAGSKSVESSITSFKGGLLFGASDGYVYLLEKDGRQRLSFNTGSAVLSAPAVYGDNIITLDFSGNLTMFKTN